LRRGEARLPPGDAPELDAPAGARQRPAARRDDRRPNAPEGPRAREPRATARQRDPQEGGRVFRTGGARPPTQLMVRFIDAHREAYGVEPICAVLPIAPSTYYEAKARERDATRRPARAL